MGSLMKEKIEDVSIFMDKCRLANLTNKNNPTEFILMEKYDGLSIQLCYENGKLISAVTRGDGQVGQDILQNVLKMKNVIKEVPLFEKYFI